MCSFEAELLINLETSTTCHPEWMGECLHFPSPGSCMDPYISIPPPSQPDLAILDINCVYAMYIGITLHCGIL